MTGQSRWSDGAVRHSITQPSPFERRGVPEVSLGARLLRRSAPASAIVALENLLADTPPLQLSIRHIARIEAQYRISSSSAAKIHLALYAKAYRVFIADNRLTDSEATYLDELRRLFTISDDDVVAIERETLIPRYARDDIRVRMSP